MGILNICGNQPQYQMTRSVGAHFTSWIKPKKWKLPFNIQRRHPKTFQEDNGRGFTRSWRGHPMRIDCQPVVPGVPLLLELAVKGGADVGEAERADCRTPDRVGRCVENPIQHQLLLVPIASTHLNIKVFS